MEETGVYMFVRRKAGGERSGSCLNRSVDLVGKGNNAVTS